MEFKLIRVAATLLFGVSVVLCGVGAALSIYAQVSAAPIAWGDRGTVRNTSDRDGVEIAVRVYNAAHVPEPT